MLQFFAPLLDDACVCLVYYTGKAPLSTEQRSDIKQHGAIEIFTKRPMLAKLVDQVICKFEGARSMSDVSRDARSSWCMLYCGGSRAIEGSLRKKAGDLGIGWQSELFDW